MILSQTERSFRSRLLAAVVLCLTLAATAPRLSAQGSLTPSGAPAPTMKSLAQVEPRTSIPGSAAGLVTPYVINQPGAYHLTGNIAVTSGNAIQIEADNVSLDLGGFTISSTAAVPGGTAIAVTGTRTNIVVRNGSIRSGSSVSGTTFTPGPGFTTGVTSGMASAMQVSDLLVHGVRDFGISLAFNSTSIRNCAAWGIGGTGLSASVVADSVAQKCATPISGDVFSNSFGSTINPATSIVYDTAADKRTPIPVSGGAYSITQPGSYYLTGNKEFLTNGITITASNVTLDLNGFTISSLNPSPSGTAINIGAGASRIVIRNGFIQGGTTYNGTAFVPAGFLDGINASPLAADILVERVKVSGTAAEGIDLGSAPNTTVSFCSTDVTAGTGIAATLVSDSQSSLAGGGSALGGSTVVRCRGQVVGSGNGISAITCRDSIGFAISGIGLRATTASHCKGYADGGTGLEADQADSCNGESDTGTGLRANFSALNSRGSSNSGIGLSTVVATNCTGVTSGTVATAVGIHASGGTVTNCQAVGGGGASLSVRCSIAIGCVTSNGTQAITNRYNMP